METGVLQEKTEEIQRTCVVWISKVVCNQWNRVLLLSKQEKIWGSLLNVVGRRLSESRVRENLMHGLRWQVMETGTTAPSLDPTLIRPSSGKDTAKTKGVHREVESEGRWRQISGLTNRNHIRL